MDFSAIETVFRSYFIDDFPKRILDALVFGGVATGAWVLVTGRARRKVLRAFLKTHDEFIRRFNSVVEAITEKKSAREFKETVRRQLTSTHKLLEGQKLHLFGRLAEPDQETLIDYFERLAKALRVIDFNVPKDWVDRELPLNYDELKPFKERITELFKPDADEGAATTAPMEEACKKLKSIVWSVYLVPVVRHRRLRMNDARRIDQALMRFDTKFGGPTASASPKELGVDPQAVDPLLQAAAAAK